MDELIKTIVDKTGISEGQARTAVETVAGFLKAKLPESVAGYVDQALGMAGSAAQNVDVGSLAASVGGLFGKK